VLSNLRGNAVKYVVEGRQPVRRIAVHVHDREGNARVEIAGSGPGLPAGAEQRVFLPLVRLADTVSQARVWAWRR